MPNAAQTTVILGAGFSYVAGLPLAKDLFNSPYLVPSQRAEQRFNAVLAEWRTWELAHPNKGPEQFLAELYSKNLPFPVSWTWAVELVAAVLATPLPQDRGEHNQRYAGRIIWPLRNRTHNAFWDLLFTHRTINGVVTLNYDILAERGIRHRPMIRLRRPGIYYGGLPRPQVLKGAALPFAKF